MPEQVRHDGKGRAVKPISPFPLIAMLVVVVFLILWSGGYLV